MVIYCSHDENIYDLLRLRDKCAPYVPYNITVSSLYVIAVLIFN